MDLKSDELLNFQKDLPTAFQYSIKSALRHLEGYLEVKLEANIHSKEEVTKWLALFSEKSKTSWSIRAARHVTGKFVVFKKEFRCIHRGRTTKVNSEANPGTRNTNCQAVIIITIFAINTTSYVQQTAKKQCKAKKTRDPNKPCEIYLRLKHNHPIHSADALRFRPVSEDVKAKLRGLFQQGHTAATAREVLRIDLISENPENYEELLADRKIYPSYQACYYNYSKEFLREFGPINKSDYTCLTDKLSVYNKQYIVPSSSWDVSDDEVIIAVCTPLMRRVHRLTSEAAEVVFIDSSGSVDRNGHKIFLLLTHNESGGVPLGIMITSSESTGTVTKALQMLKELIGKEAFFGADGPSVFMTNDSASERDSLGSVWPQATLLLCLFNVLQAVWRWLQKAENGVLKADRVHLFRKFKAIGYAESEEECCELFESLKNDPVAKKAKKFIDHISSRYWDRRGDWALHYRSGKLMQGSNTNNSAEVAVRVLKEKVFEQVKDFDLMQLIDYILTRLEGYYERKLLDAAHDRCTPRADTKKAWLAPPSGILSKIVELGNNTFQVPSQSSSGSYLVDGELKMCECSVGNCGDLCKHQLWVSIHQDRPLIAARSTDVRKKLYIIATGKMQTAVWLRPLLPKPTAGQSNESCGDSELEANLGSEPHLIPKPEADAASSSDRSELEGGEPMSLQEEMHELSANGTAEENLSSEPHLIPKLEVNAASSSDRSEFEGGEPLYLQEDMHELSPNGRAQSDLEKEITQFTSMLKARVEGSEETLLPAFRVMVANFSKIKTPAALASAFITFGKGAGNKRRGSRIAVQPTAISRRRT